MGFTKIFKQMSMSILGQQSSTMTLSNITFKDVTGTERTGTQYQNNYYPVLFTNWANPASYFVNTSTSFATTTKFKIGYGDSAPSDEDYELEHPYVPGTDYNGIANVSTIGYDTVAKKTYRSCALTITAVNNLTIKEIGFYLTFGTTNPYYTTLVYRTVLPEAINLAAGQSVTLDLRIAGG